jgi:lipoprotein-anchoring transpeptidase ErfK/SrfK
LPGVVVGGVALGGQTSDEAAATLRAAWATIILRDGDRAWQIPPAQIGITLDADGSARMAAAYGRAEGNSLNAILRRVNLAPILIVDGDALARGVAALAAQVDIPARNATVQVANGQIIAVPATSGRTLDTKALTDRLLSAAGAELAQGTIALPMSTTAPAVTDAAPLLAKGRALLAASLTISAYDPVSNETIPWVLPPAQWGPWLTTVVTPSGADFALEAAPLRAYLTAQSAALGKGRRVEADPVVAALNSALRGGATTVSAIIRYAPRTLVAQAGDTYLNIGWRIGIPGWRIAALNPSIPAPVAGQTITLPPLDGNFDFPVIPNKRIVVSISRQHMWVYENGALKWDWLASTGMSESPTMPGVYQILSHVPNAYAGNWNLDMPHFMGIYEAVPGFTNGIHGMPTRGGYSILWENALGRPVTYGCILISNANAAALYQWAQEGVVVEVQA